MSYKFVQISDIGFNHSLSSDTELNKHIENRRRKAFEKVVDLCIKEKATALLICGNLYDEEHISFENARLIKKGFAKLRANDTAIVYAHGKMDKHFFLDSIENDVLEIKSRYTKHVYSLPFDIDTVNFIGIGYSKRLVFQDEFLEDDYEGTPTIGLMYIDNELYNEQTIELLKRRMEKSGALYWGVGGNNELEDIKKDSNYLYTGHCCPKLGDGPSCALIKVSNKMKVSSKLIDICNDIYKEIKIDDAYMSKDIYQLLERCTDLIVESKVPGHNMIINLELNGPCTCYDELKRHRKEFQKEIGKITDTNLAINIKNLTKEIKNTPELEDETQVNELLEECMKLYDDEDLYNRTVTRLKKKRVFFSSNTKSDDKKKILEGVDSIILESQIKEDSHDH